MFTKPLDFTRVRSGKEAVGFYIVQFALALIAAGVISTFYGVATGSNAFTTGLKIGSIVAGIWSIVAAFMVLRSHRLTGKVGFVMLAIIAGAVGLFGGALFGLIIPAYLTTRRK
jgi:hypothetical protein